MNEVMRAITERNSCRDFFPDAISQSDVETIVQAALSAPSAMNKMPWHIIAVTDKALIEEMDTAAMQEIAGWDNKAAFDRMKERGGRVFYNAPCMIFVTNDGTEYSTIDGGIVTQNVTLAAHSLGLGSVIVAMAKIPLNGPRGEEFKKRLKFPEGHTFGMAICVGNVQTGKAPHEHDTSKVTYIKG